ncbi:MAG: hypothetical protein EOS57_12740 [Mesorhizobium sp.]|nr:MAG: hypothetical protein EOQ43_15560 [Mesorhizobium sp.]RWB35408.1 MAG: hypothetical protein EOQ41_05190 [Mesorhizobium sp.]RWD19415.1 MAG: hypothetical protein EOS57_12740 [Mesorhizobium sp.]RWD29266.1 MAG: hypothetical protein EOS34_28875 [Mesorhizobium sp.]RWD44342.1 MAG: hypothetical protein EOS35_17495 [Mesorhizobium sp.]
MWTSAREGAAIVDQAIADVMAGKVSDADVVSFHDVVGRERPLASGEDLRQFVDAGAFPNLPQLDIADRGGDRHYH